MLSRNLGMAYTCTIIQAHTYIFLLYNVRLCIIIIYTYLSMYLREYIYRYTYIRTCIYMQVYIIPAFISIAYTYMNYVKYVN